MAIIRSAGGVFVSIAAILLLICAATPAGGTDGAKGALDGRVFLVERGKKGEKANGIDLVHFRNGIFRSISCDRFGCEGPYTSSADGETIAFTADASTKSRGTIHWEGTVEGDRIEVRYTESGISRWYGFDPNPTEYWARSIEVPSSEGPGNLLDGKTFVIETGMTGKEADHADIIIFWDGRFVSTKCEYGGFRRKGYTAAPAEDGIRFRGEVDSPEKGSMVWEGTVRGDLLEGTMRWTHEKWYWTIEREYWYRGRLYE